MTAAAAISPRRHGGLADGSAGVFHRRPLHPVLSGHALEVTDSNVPRTSANRSGRPAGTEIFASPTRSRWNSLNARLTALAGWGEAGSAVTNRTGPKRRGMVRGMK
jgi:hypothetical protein